MESFPDLEGKTSENSNISFHMGLYSTLMVMVIAQGVFFLAIIPVFTALSNQFPLVMTVLSAVSVLVY